MTLNGVMVVILHHSLPNTADLGAIYLKILSATEMCSKQAKRNLLIYISASILQLKT